MAQIKTGSRMRSQVCSTEVMVIGAPASDIEVTCGGAPMVDMSETPADGLSIGDGVDQGTVLGKRYTNEAADLELLCTKPGDGSLGANGETLSLKEAKALPSSD
jgi:hypothetical protein